MGKKRKIKAEPRLDEGLFCAAAGGFGFVERKNGETVFIPASKVRNAVTNETVCQMRVACNGLEFDVCINEKDLLGVPETGRRFKGNIWRQGRIGF